MFKPKKISLLIILTFIFNSCISQDSNMFSSETSGDDSKQEYEVSLSEAANQISYETILGENRDSDKIVTDLNLPRELEDEIKISWSSSSQYLISNGQVTRPYSDEVIKDPEVKLTAKIYRTPEDLVTREFDLKILKLENKDEDAVERVYRTLNSSDILGINDETEMIYHNLKLIKEYEYGTTIDWEISNPDFVTANGEITRPDANSDDARVKLVANIKKNNYKRKKDFEVNIIKKSDTVMERIENSKSALTENLIRDRNLSLERVDKDLNLVKEGIDGTKIEWEIVQNSNDSIKDISGIIRSDGNIDFSKISKEVVVQLKASVLVVEDEKNSTIKRVFEEPKYFDVRLIPINEEGEITPPSRPRVIIEDGWITIISEGAEEIYYTLDGTDPTDPNNPNRRLYTEPIKLRTQTHVRAAGFINDIPSSKYGKLFTWAEIGIPQPLDIDPIIYKTPAPTFDPDGYSVVVPIPIEINAADDAKIYYTTDGSAPTENSNEYKKPIVISETTTIYARAYREGYTKSNVASATFEIKEATKVANPRFSIAEGSYTEEKSIEITTSTPDADIYYEITTDGSEPGVPTNGSTKYTTSITAADAQTTKIEAIGIKDGLDDSDVVSATYVIDSTPTVDSVVISPSSDQNIFVGDTLQFSATAKDSSGNTIVGYSSFTYSMKSGGDKASIDSGTGLLTANATGTAEVSVTADGKTDDSGTITISDPSVDAITYAGTTYDGKKTAGTGNPETRSDADISVTSPTVADFDANGFFRMQGSVNGAGAYQYAWIVVSKTNSFTTSMDGDWNSSNDTTAYWVRGDFDRRIWLPFGAGEYVIEVIKAEVTTNNLNYDGDINGWGYTYPAIYTFTVNNTRDEDGTFKYPSGEIQSDDTRIYNKAVEVINNAGVSAGTNEDKAKAIHDYVVAYLQYDHDSLDPGQRKKQDALTTYLSGSGNIVDPSVATAVCEGYASLFVAMLRSQGIRAKAVAGTGGGGAHAWAEVEATDDSGTYKLVDPTWNDPGPNDDNPASVRYDYWWIDNYSTAPFSDTHVHEYDRPQRVISRSSSSGEETIKDDGTIWYYITK